MEAPLTLRDLFPGESFKNREGFKSLQDEEPGPREGKRLTPNSASEVGQGLMLFLPALLGTKDSQGSGTHLWLCWAISKARRVGTGEPPPPASVMLRTSMDLRSGRRFPCRLSMGESTRFRGGSKGQEFHLVRGQCAPLHTELLSCLTDYTEGKLRPRARQDLMNPQLANSGVNRANRAVLPLPSILGLGFSPTSFRGGRSWSSQLGYRSFRSKSR